MKNMGTLLAAVFVAVVLVLYMCTFQVRYTEVAIRKTWDKPDANAVTTPGLHFKWPRPIQTVVKYDRRVRILEDRTEETRTRDAKTVLLTTFTLWRIENPSTFHTNFPEGVDDGEGKLRTTIRTHKHAVIGKHRFNELVSMDPNQRKVREIENTIKRAVAADALKEFGIEIVDFGIKRLGVPESVTTRIFDRMKTQEQSKAADYTAEGKATADAILANATAMRDRIMAEVRRKVASIRTEADELVSKSYEEFEDYPRLRMYLDSLRGLKTALSERATIILDQSQPPFNLFSADERNQVPIRDGVTEKSSAGSSARAQGNSD